MSHTKSSWWTMAAPIERGRSLRDLTFADPEAAADPEREAHGFGRAVIRGLNEVNGDAVVIMMADESDDCRDVVRYWQTLNQGWDCVFGSRFVDGGGMIDYPWFKLVLNRMVNLFLRDSFSASRSTTRPTRSRPIGTR